MVTRERKLRAILIYILSMQTIALLIVVRLGQFGFLPGTIMLVVTAICAGLYWSIPV